MWLVNVKRKDVYEVLEFDPDSKKAKLKGKYTTFEQKLDVARLKQSGYVLMKENPYAK